MAFLNCFLKPLFSKNNDFTQDYLKIDNSNLLFINKSKLIKKRIFKKIIKKRPTKRNCYGDIIDGGYHKIISGHNSFNTDNNTLKYLLPKIIYNPRFTEVFCDKLRCLLYKNCNEKQIIYIFEIIKNCLAIDFEYIPDINMCDLLRIKIKNNKIKSPFPFSVFLSQNKKIDIGKIITKYLILSHNDIYRAFDLLFYKNKKKKIIFLKNYIKNNNLSDSKLSKDEYFMILQNLIFESHKKIKFKLKFIKFLINIHKFRNVDFDTILVIFDYKYFTLQKLAPHKLKLYDIHNIFINLRVLYNLKIINKEKYEQYKQNIRLLRNINNC